MKNYVRIFFGLGKVDSVVASSGADSRNARGVRCVEARSVTRAVTVNLCAGELVE